MKALENLLINGAFTLLTRRLKTQSITLAAPKLAKQYLVHKLIAEEREIFGALWLDVKSRLIGAEDISLGTIHRASIFPREILKSALRHNAANAIFYHCHPTGDPMPSESDKAITMQMKDLLQKIDVTLVDHIIVSGASARSFVENGEM